MSHPARVINMNLLGQALTEVDDPPVMAMYVYNSNPAAVAPSQDKVMRGLEREDLFLAVHDIVLTDTARYVDIVLSANTHWGHEDLYHLYWAVYAEVADQLISPVVQ